MSTQIQITPKSGITIGSTAITSGTDTRVLFQNGGVVQQDSDLTWNSSTNRLTIGASTYLQGGAGYSTSFATGWGLYNCGLQNDFAAAGYGIWNARDISIGMASPSAKLDIKAGGALSTDLALRIRNSADTANLLDIRGNGNVNIGVSAFNDSKLNIRSAGGTTHDFTIDNSGGSDYQFRMRADGFFLMKYQNPIYRIQETTTNSYFSLCGENGFQRLETANTFHFSNGSSGSNTHTWMLSSGKWGFGMSPSAVVDVKAQGALSTDLAFRVRNSANTKDSFIIDGLGQGRIRSTSFIPKFSISYVSDTGADRDAFIFTQNVQNSMGRAWTFDAGFNGNQEGLRIFNDLAGNDRGIFTIQANNYCFGTEIVNLENTADRRVLRIANGVAPTTSKADEIKFYSADIVAGNAAPHFRTENGSVIKLYKQDLPTNPTNAEIATFLSNLGLANLI